MEVIKSFLYALFTFIKYKAGHVSYWSDVQRQRLLTCKDLLHGAPDKYPKRK